MNHRPFDLMIYGASGFTGQRVAEHLATMAPSRGIRWSIAGRDRTKLESLAKDLKLKSDQIRVSASDDASKLKSILSETRLLLNCAGPFSLSGLNVVSACIESSTDYLDITGEPQFIDESALTFHDRAQEKMILIVHACGFDSIPAELGWLRLEKEARARGDSLTSIESYLSLHAHGKSRFVANHTTLESGVLSFQNAAHGNRIQRSLSQKRSANSVKRLPTSRRLKKFIRFEPGVEQWVLPFLDIDSKVVKNSQVLLSMRFPEQSFPRFLAYFGSRNPLSSIKTLGASLVILLMMQTKLSTKWLFRFPQFFSLGLFSKTGPSLDDIKQIWFEMDLLGYSNGGKRLHLKVKGPEPGYVTTPRLLLQTAFCVLEDRRNLPIGGVYTPAAAFFDSSLEQRAEAAGLSLEMIEGEHAVEEPSLRTKRSMTS